MQINYGRWTAPHLRDLSGLWRLLRIEDDLLARGHISDWLLRKTKYRPWMRDHPVEMTIVLVGVSVKKSLSTIVLRGE